MRPASREAWHAPAGRLGRRPGAVLGWDSRSVPRAGVEFMDLLIVVAVVAALPVGAFLGPLLRRPATRGSPVIAALTGRISQMADPHTAVQSAILERTKPPEPGVVKQMDPR